MSEWLASAYVLTIVVFISATLTLATRMPVAAALVGGVAFGAAGLFGGGWSPPAVLAPVIGVLAAYLLRNKPANIGVNSYGAAAIAVGVITLGFMAWRTLTFSASCEYHQTAPLGDGSGSELERATAYLHDYMAALRLRECAQRIAESVTIAAFFGGGSVAAIRRQVVSARTLGLACVGLIAAFCGVLLYGGLTSGIDHIVNEFWPVWSFVAFCCGYQLVVAAREGVAARRKTVARVPT